MYAVAGTTDEGRTEVWMGYCNTDGNPQMKSVWISENELKKPVTTKKGIVYRAYSKGPPIDPRHLVDNDAILCVNILWLKATKSDDLYIAESVVDEVSLVYVNFLA